MAFVGGQQKFVFDCLYVIGHIVDDYNGNIINPLE